MDISSIFVKIKEYLQYSIDNDDYELETILTSKINEDTFKRIFNFLVNEFEQITENNNETLDIRIVSAKKYEKYRLTIDDKSNILRYCKTNQVDKNQLKYGEKKRLAKYPPIISDNYPFRMNLKVDTELNDSEKIEEIYKTLKNAKKYFRHKKRFSFLSKSKLFKVDITIVKSSSKNSKNLVGSGLLKNVMDYEFEVEFLNKDLNDNINLDKLINELFNIVGNMLLISENTNYLMTLPEKDDVKKSYIQLAFDMDKKKAENFVIKNPKHHFIGPQPVTLELQNLLVPELSKDSILNNYSVTDKADGERNLLYIHTDNRVYLINNRLRITYTGLKHSHAKTIIDGELITKDRFGNKMNLYAAFDIYYHKGTNVSNKPLISKGKDRLDILKDIIESKENKFVPVNKENKLTVKLKEFKYGNDKRILKHSKTIIDNHKNDNIEYYVDGLIFTPINLNVGAKREGDNSTLTGTWNKVFKWKPVEDNTIDFLINFISDIELEGEKYKYCKLYVGYNQDLEIEPLKILKHEFEDNIYAKKEFGEVYLKYNSSRNLVTKDEDIINDNMIVEFAYDNDVNNEFLKWIPYRVRHDKTELYKMTNKISGTANDFSTAQNVWNTIQYPVTYELITGAGIVDENTLIRNSDDSDVYYAREVSRNESLLKEMNSFHNYYVKNQYLYNRFRGKKSLFEIACGKAGDIHKWSKSNYKLCIGTDISKDNIYNVKDGAWKRYIQGVKKGSINTETQKMLFLTLDASKEWNKQYVNSIDDEKSQRFAKILFGLINKSDFEKDETSLLKFYNKINKKFNLVSCQFAIHYMFENNNTLDNVVKNIDMLLKEDGYFFGTCLDGYLVNEKLKNTNMIKGEIDGKLAWSIEKDYDNYSSKPLENIGKKIKVYIQTINQILDEYLVDYELLKYKLGQYNIRPVEDKDLEQLKLKSSSGSFEDIFNEVTSNKKNKVDMNDLQKEFSFLNRFFIFKKYSN
jgi:SAM-dependent methyltransferase